MAREEIEIVNGPGNFDLMFALFDETTKLLYFETVQGDIQRVYGVHLVPLKKLYRNNTDSWEITGICHMYNTTDVTIKYRSDTRKGTLSFDDGAEVKKVLDNDRKARALMIIIGKMVAKYQDFQNENGYEQDEEFFKLFNVAKGVNFAEDPKSLNLAIEKI